MARRRKTLNRTQAPGELWVIDYEHDILGAQFVEIFGQGLWDSTDWIFRQRPEAMTIVHFTHNPDGRLVAFRWTTRPSAKALLPRHAGQQKPQDGPDHHDHDGRV